MKISKAQNSLLAINRSYNWLAIGRLSNREHQNIPPSFKIVLLGENIVVWTDRKTCRFRTGARNIRNLNVKFQHATRRKKALTVRCSVKRKSVHVNKNSKYSFRRLQNAFIHCFMTFIFGDVSVSSKKRHVITLRRAVFEVKTEYSYALLLSKYKVFQTTNQNVGNK